MTATDGSISDSGPVRLPVLDPNPQPPEIILGRLHNVKRNKWGWMACCPGHDDHNPSLSIAVGTDGRILLRCHAGCPTQTVVEALDLTMADLQPDRAADNLKIAAVYKYIDEHDKLLFEVVRLKPKGFRQRRPNGRGGYLWNLRGVRRVPYRLPEVMKAVATGTVIYIAEGEKDVEALEAAGAVATCNPSGAGKWRDEYSTFLKGAEVVIVTDKDEPGRKHAGQVAASLRSVKANVCIVEAREGKDAFDHLQGGHGLDEFVRVDLPRERAGEPAVAEDPDTVSQSGEHDRNNDNDLCVCFADIEAKPVHWVWQSWIPAGMPSILFGLSGLGKSHIYTDIAARISRGAEFPDGSRAPRGNVIILSAEDAAESVLKPRLVYAKADCSRIFHFPSVARFDERGKRVFSLVEDLEILKKNIVFHEAILAVVDPVTAYLSGVESHIVAEVRAALALIEEVAQSTEAAFLCIMHPNKNMSGDMKAVQRLSGSGAFGDAPRCVMLAAEDPDRKDEKRRLLLPAKMNLGLWPEGFGYTITADGPLTCSSRVTWDHDPVTVNADEAMAPRRRPSPGIQAAMDFLAAALGDGDWHSARDLIDEAAEHHISQKTLERAAKQQKVTQRKVGFPAVSEWCSEADF